MPETALGIPLNILFVLVTMLVAVTFLVSFIFLQKDSAEKAVSIIGGVLSAFSR